MKNSYLLIVAIGIILTFSSCSKEKDEISLSNSISQIEDELNTYGEGKVTFCDPNGNSEKAILWRKYQQEMLATISKTDLKSALAYIPVGVFRYGSSCGQYQTIDIGMDCEDGNSTYTRIEGNPGASYVTSSRGGNVHLLFCVVDGSLFNRNPYNYGVLSLHSGYLKPGVTQMHRQFDNEDTNTQNSWPGSYNINDGGDGHSYLNKDTHLYFDVFTSDGTTPSILMIYFPDLGIPYGVLGRNFTYSYGGGTIWTNDEDTNNFNLIEYVPNPIISFKVDKKNGWNQSAVIPFGILNHTPANTGIYVTQVRSIY